MTFVIINKKIMAEIEIYRGDITKLKVDAIVNAANRTLLGGGGVDGAIHRAAGGELLRACRELNGCATGDAKITKGYKLPAKFVIHTVGPVWHGGKSNEDELLSSAYRRSLEVAVNNSLRTIAFPNISTGIYGFPKERAAKIAIDTVLEFTKTHKSIEKVIFVIFDNVNYQIYKKLLHNMM
jgi:O-acetyl-ADP-ribose deacetylase (regulator of RNase III)